MFILMALALLQELPADAKTIVEKADVKIEQLRKAYEEACTKIKAQEVKDLQRVHDAVKKGDPAGATAVKAKIDALMSDVAVAVKGMSSVEQWLQGKWIIMFQGSGDVMEFSAGKLVGSGIGDRTKGKYKIEAGTISLIWDTGYVETLRVPQSLSDEAPGMGRNGAETFKRLKP